ncbi:MAG: HEAT repeat domain-containing protein [Desulfuromonadaceae bacterium]|nr:HEAT repeat domain-containing protein [Desulfuromonadaceae bacterium]MDD2854034.1 HEAT repeat domain-containing protein [Desulfuromonadaceae bacterium]
MEFYRPPTTQGTIDALGSVYRAVRAWRFYPQGHPSRRSTLVQAHKAMLELIDNNSLSLSVGRTGFSFPDGEFIKDTSGISAALAYELFIRRVQKITFHHDLFQEDLLELLKILCLSPDMIVNVGGIDSIMAESGIRSIWINEFDLAIIRGKRQKVEENGMTPPGFDEVESGMGWLHLTEEILPREDAATLESQLDRLLERLSLCTDYDTYLILTRQVVAHAETVQVRYAPRLLFPLIELFARHARSESIRENLRECAKFAIEQIVSKDEILQALIEIAGERGAVSKAALIAALKAGGATAVIAAIEMMGRTESLKTRKTLSTALGNLGEASVPALLTLIKDDRWFITRNICAILGMIASSDSLDALIDCLNHADLRVRKTAVRSLAQLKGDEAEIAVIDVLQGKDEALYPQAVTSLGGMKSRKSLPELMKIIFSRDMFLKSLPLKMDALAAVALIGEPQVTPHLAKLLEERHLFAAARGRQLKMAISECLAKVGDERAIPALKNLAAGDGELSASCQEAVEAIERKEGRLHGNS